MSYARRLALALGVLLGAGLAATAAQAAAPAGRGRPELVGTYQRAAKDVIQPDGSLRDVYEDLLVTSDSSYRLRLPQGTHLHGGTPIRVRGRLAGDGQMAVEEVQALGEPAAVATTGTTKVLVILATWTSPDSVTTAQAKSQIFGDDDGWFGEASYGQLGLSGTATPWVTITAPTGGHCYANHMEIMTRAKAKALALGYDSANYHRTIVYFPRCGDDASGTAGWAYQPGTEVWLNGYMDRRVSIHEQGHNYGLAHAHTYDCTQSSVRVTLSTAASCYYVEYGDDYDSMGGSSYAGHFSASMKDQLGWLAGRKRTLTSTETTFTLPPFETAGATPLAAVTGTTVDTRKYWIEYRQAVGYDNKLPAGATGGVLVHMRDSALVGGDAPFLLDMSPQDPFGTSAVIPPGGAWTSPEGVRISVGAVTASGAEVTVKGGADPPTKPGVPRNVSAVGGDGSVKLTWDPPLSNGGATILQYVVTRSPGGSQDVVDGSVKSLTVDPLTNGTQYGFTVAARNAAGTGTASAVVNATPTVALPSATLTAPGSGATVSGMVALAATATPNAVSGSPISFVSFEVDGDNVGSDDTAPYTAQWDTSWVADGEHVVTATAYDEAWRYKASAPVNVTVVTPKPAISITSPANDAVVTADTVTLEATSAPAAGSAATVQWVTYELVDGTTIGYASGTAPHSALWDASALNGSYDVVAKVYDTDGRMGTSAPVHVTFNHPVPSVALTSPAEGATVSGSAVPLAATATPSAVSGADIAYVEFYAGSTYVSTAWSAPYAVDWDTGSLVGGQVLTAVAHDTDNRQATSAPRTVTVDNPVPSVAVTSPGDFATVGGLVAVTASATPSAASGSPIASVTLTVDGWTTLGPIAAPGPYTASWDSTGLYGQHTVVATATDEAGRTGQSATVTFTVPPPKPTAVITSPSDGATIGTGQVALTVAAAPDATTQTPLQWADFYVDGQWVGWDESLTGGAYSVPWTATEGTHVVTAEVYDNDFWTGTAPAVSVTVANKPGVPVSVTAVAGSDGTATVSWSPPASDGGSPVTGYLVKTGGTTKAGTSPYVFTGLANGTAYTFSVAAVNAAGTGSYSALTATVTPGTRTSLSRSVSPTTVTYGKYVTVKGTLRVYGTTTPVPGSRTVQLLACTPGTTSCAVAKSVTTTTGAVTMTYAPKAHKDLKLRYLRTTDKYLSVTTTAVRVRVAALVTSSISRTSMALGGTATVYGKVAPAHYGKRAYLQRLTSTGWKSLTYKTQGTTGSVSFAVKPAARGTWTYRVYFAGDADHLAGYSASRAVKVT